jgi:hypothetical protein
MAPPITVDIMGFSPWRAERARGQLHQQKYPARDGTTSQHGSIAAPDFPGAMEAST